MPRSEDPRKSFDWGQYFPPKPTFTDASIPSSLAGKVYIVTGANSGMGNTLAGVLYARGAKVYATCRTTERATQAIAEIKKAEARSQANGGELVPLVLDLADLNSVREAAQTFLAREGRLHMLWNNAGVMASGGKEEAPARTAQGIELALGVNCVGTFLLTRLLTPALATAAREASTVGSVRVVWLSSFGLEHFAPRGKGVDMDNIDYERETRGGIDRYGISKAGDWLLGVEYGRRHAGDGIVSVAINPGNLQTGLARDQGLAFRTLAGLITYPPMNGVYTQLFAAFSPDVNAQVDWTRDWIVPWGRIVRVRPDLVEAVLPREQGGNGNAQAFWEWNEKQIKDYL
ncbi:NAD(P)-binding protein [Cryphonectria parasitica EP155]|uniref:NAD(P)-binding protein n=1 Tax=Cryphonectria parasitica (strain ATCC 38755 / EP155) TaxID=660469 RepID=A0A9P4XYY6_CRYP1|nr:NAD(P)-binding protein [Cryphonectria parasitica EP155]KAF3763927.1 NAD(P)-binding protein [Cryphonectria parasitica EP155]